MLDEIMSKVIKSNERQIKLDKERNKLLKRNTTFTIAGFLVGTLFGLIAIAISIIAYLK